MSGISKRSPASPLRREPNEVVRAGKRRNSHHSAVFGRAGNGAVMGISELSILDEKDVLKKFALYCITDLFLVSKMFLNLPN